jgi:predicted DNA-binding protein
MKNKLRIKSDIVNSPKRYYFFAMQTLTLKVPDELAERLNRRARDLNRPKSEIIRQALTAQLNGKKKTESLLARAGDLVGMYASGRKDSSHKRHLKNLGRKNLGQWKRS